ncbi:hypothetical protein L2E82_17719 [Cichorium intybus]|uniref:Uncharacterized protein n=1 Tax=Cichorium intybus TaxID=13427 RepID=A0ACB9FA25_CICIN|nr:hypothetical protein L2E82_17719 [Cichorium intybus]
MSLTSTPPSDQNEGDEGIIIVDVEFSPIVVEKEKDLDDDDDNLGYLKFYFTNEVDLLKKSNSNHSESMAKIIEEKKKTRGLYKANTHSSLVEALKLIDEAKAREYDLHACVLKTRSFENFTTFHESL